MQDFAITPSEAGLVVAVTQIGYALRLVFIVPLGDLVDPRRLIVRQILLSAGALGIVALAETSIALFIGMVGMGVLAVVVQILVAFAAKQARPGERGRAVGIVTSGVVTGILGARFVAGLIADLGGWRAAVYLCSAGLSLVMAGLLRHALRAHTPPESVESYRAALGSIPSLFLHDRVILRRGLLALLIFAAFSTFWTALVLPLSQDPFSYSHTQIGLFGLVGVAGALAASRAGRLADQGLGQRTTRLALGLLTLSWGLVALLPYSVLFLVAGVVLLDLAVQAVHVTNQAIILARHPQTSSRLIGGYMVFYSVGSAVGGLRPRRSMLLRAGWGYPGLDLQSVLPPWLSGRWVSTRA